jgi:hypothetical protein
MESKAMTKKPRPAPVITPAMEAAGITVEMVRLIRSEWARLAVSKRWAKEGEREKRSAAMRAMWSRAGKRKTAKGGG